MLAAIAIVKAKAGSEAEFLAVAHEMAVAVNANEEGCLSYEIFQGDNPQTFIFIERYQDEAATDAHRSSDHAKTIGARMGPFMAGRPDVQRLNLA